MIVRKVTLSLYIGNKYTIPFISLYIVGGRRGRDRIIAWKVDLQLHMQSVPITTNVWSSNPVRVRCTRYISM